MFELEKVIRRWKKSLRRITFYEDADIEELETHLRDEIETLLDSGMDIESAFKKAKSNIGDPVLIGEELYRSRIRTDSVVNQLSFNFPLFKNHLKVIIRKLKRNHGFTLLNITGLSIGFMVCLLILLYIRDELSYDKFHKNADRIYRIENEIKESGTGKIRREARVPITWAETLEKEYPAVEKAARIAVSRENVLVSFKDDSHLETDFCYADNDIFDIFTFEFISGNGSTPLMGTNSAVITESFAKKYFGNRDPIGKRLRVEVAWYGSIDYEITAVIQDLPHNSHFRFSLLLSFETLANQLFVDINQDWGIHFYYTYLLLKPGTDLITLDDQFGKFINIHYDEETSSRYNPELVPLEDIYFHTEAETAIGPRSDSSKIIILSAIALFIVGIAIFNYVNLSTSQSLDKAKETGVRKVVGASRFSLIRLFLIESVSFCLVAFIFAISVSYLILPYFNQLAGKQHTMDFYSLSIIIPCGLAISILIGIVAGLYPAFFLSSFKPTVIIRRLTPAGNQSRSIRTFLVSLQFCISIFLIIATLVVYKQLIYFQTKDLGFKSDGIVEVKMVSRNMINHYLTLKKEFENLNSVRSASASVNPPGSELYYADYFFYDLDEGPRNIEMARYHIDHDYYRTMNIKIIAGTTPNYTFDSDSSGMLVINEAAVREMGIKDPRKAIGQRVRYERTNGDVIYSKILAVCEDFHHESLHQKLVPIIMDYWQEELYYLNVRLSNINRNNINQLERIYTSVFPAYPFEYTILNERIAHLYEQEVRLARLFLIFTLLAILISNLGLYGISASSIARKTKEIGIRKVFGAGTWEITRNLSKDMLRLVFFSFVLTVPVAYHIMVNWLEKFAYRVNIDVSIFIFSGVLILITSLIAVGWQSLKAGRMNPAKSLRIDS
jgi:putative ABC transport system permease protein